MKLTKDFSVQVDQNLVQERLTAYLQGAGYKRISSGSDLVFRRGSMVGSLTSFTPKGWLVTAKVLIQPNDTTTKLFITLDISSTGQMVTEKERRFWEEEVNALLNAATVGIQSSKVASETASSSLKENLFYTALVLAFTIGMSVAFRLAFHTRISGYLGGLVGLIIGYIVVSIELKVKRPGK